MTLDKKFITNALTSIKNPITGVDIISENRVQGLVIKDQVVGFVFDITGLAQSAAANLQQEITQHLKTIDGINDVNILLTAERPPSSPPATQRRHVSATDLQQNIAGIKHIIAVASGKGGVGKSTVSINLALALNSQGHSVGILDADIYGPSLPTLLNLHERIHKPEGKQFSPLEKYGLKAMSIGFFIDPETPTIWRGPMVMGAIEQMLRDCAWGELDYLIVDMPPGTGDAQLTLAQRVPVKGAIILSTPQDLSLIDARKGLKMFEKVGVPILGLIENMSYFICPHCNEPTAIFHQHGAELEAKKLGIPLLASLPLDPLLREVSDAGHPIVISHPQHRISQQFLKIAEKISQAI